MKIARVTVSNYENLNTAAVFPCDHMTVAGRNGAGKSALGRAIMWAMTGKDMTGSAQCDHIMQDPAGATMVRVELEGGMVVERRKTMKATTLKINGVRCTAAEALQHGLPNNAEQFMASTWPGFFSAQQAITQRALFVDILPAVNRAELFNKRTGLDPEKHGITEGYHPARAHRAAAQQRLDAEYTNKATDQQVQDSVLRESEAMRELKLAREAPPATSAWDETTDGRHLQALQDEGEQLAEALKVWTEWAQLAEKYKAATEQRAEKLAAMREAGDPDAIRAELDKLETEYKALLDQDAQHTDWEAKARAYNAAKDAAASARAKWEKALQSADKCPVCERAPETGHQRSLIAAALAGTPAEAGLPADPGDGPEKPDRAHMETLRCAIRDTALLVNEAKAAKQELARQADMPQPTAPGPEPAKPNNHRLEWVRAEYKAMRDRKLEAQAHEKGAQQARVQAATAAHATAVANLQAAKELRAEAKAALDLATIVDEALHPVRGIEAEVLASQLDALPAWFSNKYAVQLMEETKTTGEQRPVFRIRLKMPHTNMAGEAITVPLEHVSEGQRIVANVYMALLVRELTGAAPGLLWVDNPDLMDWTSYEDAIMSRALAAGLQVVEARVTEHDALTVAPAEL